LSAEFALVSQERAEVAVVADSAEDVMEAKQNREARPFWLIPFVVYAEATDGVPTATVRGNVVFVAVPAG
jgi:hypothetical protein